MVSSQVVRFFSLWHCYRRTRKTFIIISRSTEDRTVENHHQLWCCYGSTAASVWCAIFDIFPTSSFASCCCQGNNSISEARCGTCIHLEIPAVGGWGKESERFSVDSADAKRCEWKEVNQLSFPHSSSCLECLGIERESERRWRRQQKEGKGKFLQFNSIRLRACVDTQQSSILFFLE